MACCVSMDSASVFVGALSITLSRWWLKVKFVNFFRVWDKASSFLAFLALLDDIVCKSVWLNYENMCYKSFVMSLTSKFYQCAL